MPSGSHILVLAILMILLFGGRKLPELGRGLGEAIRSFKKGLNEDEIDVNKKEIEKDKADKR
jgi:sec-independent protein translocase protein TatA